jgi:hypothetical protein
MKQAGRLDSRGNLFLSLETAEDTVFELIKSVPRAAIVISDVDPQSLFAKSE